MSFGVDNEPTGRGAGLRLVATECYHRDLPDGLLIAVTEKRTREEIDKFVSVLKKV